MSKFFVGAVHTPLGPLIGLYNARKECIESVEGWAHEAVGGLRGFYYNPYAAYEKLSKSLTGECISLGSPLAPPVSPSSAWGVGRSYGEHAREMGMEKQIAFFAKPVSSLTGHLNRIIVPPVSEKPDYEGEIVVVIGSRIKNASPREAAYAIAGYTAGADITDRLLQETMSWSMAKGLDTYGPVGPVVAIADSPGDIEGLCVETRLNGERVQRGCTSDMIASIPEIISRLSTLVTLRPSDIVFTGTPPGVGHARRPPRYLRHGDEVKVTVSGLPSLRNVVEAVL
ncbi:fumarylacetoacetate hydrolase family protein [Aeropyrum camini]|uniref:Fumarylacetoacetate hydrolase n=1 Tax=Aeropyrum camini SY1 = JCM 12091 TaxID=1198449 RepID=U3TBT8_9CREN|nr:fumarylacetoacetate hydrolase family protein [Aeropyrum camini]BAN89510.1 fumarylacetoacetate hydrolase [Aeropyrum camini SY1 = JCM 12091]